MKTLVIYFNLDGFAVQLKNHIEDALDELQIEWQECHISQAAEMSATFQPTMHLFFHPNKQIYDYLPQIKEMKGHKLLWSMEDPYESDLTFDMLPYFYYIFTSDENTANELQKSAPGNSIKYVPHACNPKVHHPLRVPWNYKSDICFIGNAYESRIDYLNRNMNSWIGKILMLVGVGYRGVGGLDEHHVIHGHISEEEMVKYANGAKVCLNLHRLNSDLDMANSRNIQPRHLNNRFYELAAMGKSQVVEGRDDMLEEIKAVMEKNPDEYSYVARLKEFYLPLLKGIGK